MPLDPGIALGGGQAQTNPLATASQAVGLGNELARNQLLQNQNALFQLQTQSQLAVGDILAKHTDPQTGEVDLKGAMADTAKSGPAAYGMQDILKKNVERQISQMDLTQKTIAMHTKIAEQTATALGTLMSKPGGGSDEDVKDVQSSVWNVYSTDPAIMDSHREAIRKQLITSFSKIPPQGPARMEWLRQHSLQFQDMKTQMDANTPTHMELDWGSGKMIIGIDKQTGKQYNLAVAGKNLTPAEGSAPVTDEYGNVVPMRRSTLAPQGGGAIIAPNVRSNAGQSNALVGVPQGSALAPTPDQSAAVAGADQEQDQAIGPRGTVPTAAPSGAGGPVQPMSKTTEELRKPAVKYVEDLNERVNVGSRMMRQLGEVVPLLDKIKTGGLGEIKAHLAQIMQGIPGVPQEWVDKVAGGDLSAAQEFSKFMVQLATQTMTQALVGNIGKFTQAEWQKFQDANPNLNTDPDAVRKIFNFITDQYKLDKEQQDDLKEARKKPNFDITTWENEWQNRLIARGRIKPEEIPVGPRGGEAPPKLSGTVKWHRNLTTRKLEPVP